ncbi:MAG: rod shape-determining protein [Candidatus Comchoanobacterales bacterium]
MTQYILPKRQRLSIDLGTFSTLVYEPNQGIVLNEPSVVAIKTIGQKQQVVAVGHDARNMLGRTPDNIQAIRPLANGVIADFRVTEIMLTHFIEMAYKKSWFRLAPFIVICVPCGSTQVERRAIREAAYGAGAKKVLLIDEPMAAALGADMPVSSATASMVVDIGGGTTEVAIISLNGIVYSESVRVGGDHFDEAIMKYVRRNFGCAIGESTAEKVKRSIATAFPSHEVKEMKISGRNVSEGIPRSFSINSNEVLEAIQDPLATIINGIRSALEVAPAELSSDIFERGMLLTGGGSLLRNIDKLITEETSLPVTIAKDPLSCVAVGGGKVLEMMEDIGEDILATE